MARPLHPVPEVEADITPGWLAAVLGSPVERITIERIGVEFGFASQLFRVGWREGDAGGPVVVKLWAAPDQAAAREVDFFRELAPRLPIRLPACHHAAWDGARAALVMEDLAPSRQGDVLTPLDLPDARRLATLAAHLHAATAGAGILDRPWLAPPRPGTRDDVWYATRRTEFLDRFGPPADPLARRLFDRLPTAGDVGRRALADAPDCLLHGDLHLDNVVFRGEEPVLLDWAGCGPGPATLELARVLFGAVQPGTERAVLDAYLHRLGDRVGAVLGGVPAEDQVAAALLVTFATWTLGVARFHPPVRPEMVPAGIERAYRAVRAWRGIAPRLIDEALG